MLKGRRWRLVMGADYANVLTRLSKGEYFLAMSFPREGYSSNKIIAYGEKVYDDFSCQAREFVNVAYQDISIVLTISRGRYCV